MVIPTWQGWKLIHDEVTRLQKENRCAMCGRLNSEPCEHCRKAVDRAAAKWEV